MVYTIAYNITGSPSEAEDASQEVFLRLYRKLGSFRGEARFSTWFYRFTLNAVADFERRQRRARPAGAAGPACQIDIVDVPEPVGDAATSAIDRAAHQALLAALAGLPPGYRAPLVLREVYGLSYREISHQLGRPLGTVKVMVHRGRGELRLRLRASGYFDEKKR